MHQVVVDLFGSSIERLDHHVSDERCLNCFEYLILKLFCLVVDRSGHEHLAHRVPVHSHVLYHKFFEHAAPISKIRCLLLTVLVSASKLPPMDFQI